MSYKDMVLCDVLPMDACHLLLGRPWQYDRQAEHDGRRNTYTVMLGRKKITLLPLVPNRDFKKRKKRDESKTTPLALVRSIREDKPSVAMELLAEEEEENVVVDALARKHALLTMMGVKLLGIERCRGLYTMDQDYQDIFAKCALGATGSYPMVGDYLFAGDKLGVPRGSARELLRRETHSGGLAGHFGAEKTLGTLQEHFVWPGMARDVRTLMRRCETCQRAEGHVRPQGLYHPLPVAERPWEHTKLLVSTTCHTQTDGQTEVVNRTLGALLRALVLGNKWGWDELLTQVKFSYNRTPHATTKVCPFEVVYDLISRVAVDLVPVASNFDVNIVAEKRAEEVGVSVIFHVQDLINYEEENEPSALRTRRSQQGENDPDVEDLEEDEAEANSRSASAEDQGGHEQGRPHQRSSGGVFVMLSWT